MVWWIWILLGIALLVGELLSPGGFYLLFFGCGALAVGLLTALGWSGPAWLQGVLFSILSVVSVLLFRRPLIRRMSTNSAEKTVDSLVGETAYPLEEIQVNAFGKAEFRGTAWNVHNVGETRVAPKQRCRIDKVDGLTLWIRAE